MAKKGVRPDFTPIKLGSLKLGVKIPEKKGGGNPNPEWKRVLGDFDRSSAETASIDVASGTPNGAISGLRNYAKKWYPHIKVESRKDHDTIYLRKVKEPIESGD